MSSDEVWVSAVGHPGYMVSDMGRVKSLPRATSRNRVERILCAYSTGKGSGYPTVSIGGKNVKVHRLVAEAFLLRLPEHECVNHKDGNTKNNAASNLEWCTQAENIQHAFDVLGKKSSGGHSGKTGARHHASKPVVAVCLTTGERRDFGSSAEAAREIGCSSGVVPRVCAGVYKSAKGWGFSYAPLAELAQKGVVKA